VNDAVKRWLIIAGFAAAAVIAYRFVIPPIIALYSHPEKLSDRAGAAPRTTAHARG
jgi:hypothetical protein